MYVSETTRKNKITYNNPLLYYSHTNTILQMSEEEKWQLYDAVCELPVWEEEASSAPCQEHNRSTIFRTANSG